jgi:Ion channel
MFESDAAAPSLPALLLQAGALLSLCVTTHAVSLVAMARALIRRQARVRSRFSADIILVIGVTTAVVLLHLVEIAFWAAFYTWKGCLPDFRTAFYFSSVTYTTVGYGDVVLPVGFRGFSSAEALSGILLTGLSSGFLFTVLSRLFGPQVSIPPVASGT